MAERKLALEDLSSSSPLDSSGTSGKFLTALGLSSPQCLPALRASDFWNLTSACLSARPINPISCCLSNYLLMSLIRLADY